MSEEFDDDAELVAELDEALASEDAPEDCMQLSELDGFLTGLAVSPEVVDPDEWLSWVCGAKASRIRSSRFTSRRW